MLHKEKAIQIRHNSVKGFLYLLILNLNYCFLLWVIYGDGDYAIHLIVKVWPDESQRY